jgi:hypothetical protein
VARTPATTEQQLIDLLRAENGPDFTLTVNRSGNSWTVSTSDRDADGSATRTGKGKSFDAAWARQALALGVHR